MKLDEKITPIYCLCDDCVKHLNYTDDVQCQMNTGKGFELKIVMFILAKNFRKFFQSFATA